VIGQRQGSGYASSKIAVVLLLLFSGAAAQTKVETLVGPGGVIEGEAFTLEVRATNGHIRSVSLLGFDDFRIIAGPSYTQSVSFVNGEMSTVTSHKWTLVAKRSGKIAIPALPVNVDGKTMRTAPIAIQVLTRQDGTVDGIKDKSLFLLIEVDNRNPYRGEQVTVTWTLYTDVSIASWEVLSLPRLTGFWSEELFAPNKLVLKERTYQGRRYYTAEVRRMALFPTRSGEIEVDPLVLKVGVKLNRRNRRDPFLNDFSLFAPSRVENREIPSLSIPINVKPIPRKNRPANYKGLVGKFKMTGGLDYNEVQQNNAVALALKISGTGNFKTLEAPIIAFPEGLEVFDPKVTTEPALGDVVGGVSTFEYVIVPRTTGKVSIPAIRLPYFNPSRRRFEVVRVGPLKLNVSPREEGPSVATGFSRREVALIGKDIRFLKSEKPRWRKSGKGWYTPEFFLLNIATVLLFAMPWANQRVRFLADTFQPGFRKRRALGAALSLVNKAHGEPAQVYGQFSRALTVFLNHKLGSRHHEYTIREARLILAAREVAQEDLAVIIYVLERAEAARFAPEQIGDIEADREALRETFAALDAQWTA